MPRPNSDPILAQFRLELKALTGQSSISEDRMKYTAPCWSCLNYKERTVNAYTYDYAVPLLKKVFWLDTDPPHGLFQCPTCLIKLDSELRDKFYAKLRKLLRSKSSVTQLGQDILATLLLKEKYQDANALAKSLKALKRRSPSRTS